VVTTRSVGGGLKLAQSKPARGPHWQVRPSADARQLLGFAELAELAFPEVGVLDETPCAICLDVIAPEDPARKLSCGHAFHASCVSSWWKCSLQQSRAQVSCPSCRVEVAVNISTALVEQQEQQLQLSTGPADEEEGIRVLDL
ncbi:unnamed protein product, partial [Polarella glacialis]